MEPWAVCFSSGKTEAKQQQYTFHAFGMGVCSQQQKQPQIHAGEIPKQIPYSLLQAATGLTCLEQQH